MTEIFFALSMHIVQISYNNFPFQIVSLSQLTQSLKLKMPSLKKLNKELCQKIVSFLIPLPSINSSLSSHLATLIFVLTRFCTNAKLINGCLHFKVIPKGFHSKALFIWSRVSETTLFPSYPGRANYPLISSPLISQIFKL